MVIGGILSPGLAVRIIKLEISQAESSPKIDIHWK